MHIYLNHKERGRHYLLWNFSAPSCHPPPPPNATILIYLNDREREREGAPLSFVEF